MNELNGQWLGYYSGTNKGHATFHIESTNKNYAGIIILADENQQYPLLTAAINASLRMIP